MQQGAPDWRVFTSSAGDQGPGRPRPDPAGPSVGARVRDRIAAARQPALLTVAVASVAAACLMGMALALALAAGPGAEGPASVGGPLLRDGSGILATAPDALGGDGPRSAGLVVDVAGAVERPGLHRLGVGDRVGDAIAAAGGFGPRVDAAEVARSLNLAEPLTDGMKVLVPALGSVRPEALREGTSSLIDLNSADEAELETLPGVGPVTAGRIIEARAQAPFREVSELRSREVVGEALFESIKALVRAGP